jgi:hypothetical protein
VTIERARVVGHDQRHFVARVRRLGRAVRTVCSKIQQTLLCHNEKVQMQYDINNAYASISSALP